nr:hypothetical protein [Mycobacterium sp. 1465703.0]
MFTDVGTTSGEWTLGLIVEEELDDVHKPAALHFGEIPGVDAFVGTIVLEAATEV